MTILFSLRNLAAKLVAAAAKELFPEVLLVDGGVTSVGFYYDFIFPFEFKENFFSLLEEKMRLIVKERRTIKILEMVPKNAAEFLKFNGHEIRAEIAKDSSQTLAQVFQMDSFIDFLEDPRLSEIGHLQAFKLQEVSREGEITRLIGTAFADKQQLKDFLKKYENFSFQSHLKLGKELNLFSYKEEEFFWHPKGECLREICIQLWKEQCRKQNFEFVTTFASSPEELLRKHFHLHREEGLSRLAECIPIYESTASGFLQEARVGLFENYPCLMGRGHVFCKENELFQETISSLQFIVKILKILGLEYEVVLLSSHKEKGREILLQALQHCQIDMREEGKRISDQGPLLEVRIEDALGRKWATSLLTLDVGKGVVIHTAFTSLERLIALLIERYRGELPFWLSPEQVRVISVGDRREEANHLYELLLSYGFRAVFDCRSEKLGKRMHDALREKVPYSICIGERERQANRVTVRAYHSPKEESMSVEAFVQLISSAKSNMVPISDDRNRFIRED